MTPEDYAHEHRERFIEELKEFLRIPSISTLPDHRADIQKAASWLAEHLRAIGIDEVEVVQTQRHPIVYGEWLGAGDDAPTALVYGHYDVQPVDPVDECHTPPFEPTIKDGNIYGRGTADDKGQLFIHLKAIESYLETEGELPINVKFLFEGEEESGSESLEPFIDANTARLDADFALISDTHILGPEQPSIVYGLRGITYMEITVQGPRRDLHSGAYGGVVDNPIHALTRMLAGLHDDDGRITVPGFYDEVVPLEEDERQALSDVPLDDAVIERDTGVPQTWGEAGYTVVERLGARPTLEVNGIWGGFTGDGAKTVIPARAHAKLSMRLVANQDPHEIYDLVMTHLTRTAPATVTIDGKLLHVGSPALIPRDIKPMRAAEAAYEHRWGKPPIFTREGGSLPVVSLLLNKLETPTVLLGFGLSDDNLHAPNEKFTLTNFYRGIDAVIYYHDWWRQNA